MHARPSTIAVLVAVCPWSSAIAQIDAPKIVAAGTDADKAAALARIAAARPSQARRAMVVSEQALASAIGSRVLARGGNAIDAAVATGYALAVVNPCCGNIGGGGFMTVHLADGRDLFLNFRERAPLKATATMFQTALGAVVPGRSTDSWLAVATPGTVMGLNDALARYGTMPLGRLMAPAIRLASKGFVLDARDAAVMAERARDFAREPNVAAVFLKDGRPWRPGERFVQRDLARTLSAIAEGGTDAFYKGAPARAVAAASAANGGLLGEEDFARYTVRWDRPIACAYHGYRVLSAPPPSSGGISVCEILQTIEAYPLRDWGFGSVRATHVIVEAERHAFADRNAALGDPEFVANPVAELIAPGRAAAIRAAILPDRATPSAQVRAGVGTPEGRHTTHFSVLDAKGNAVSVTYTINFLFGAGRIASDTGFLLNNEMDDFTARPGTPNGFGLVQGAANAIAPGKRPLSSMAPTILLKDGRVAAVVGSPGGRRSSRRSCRRSSTSSISA